MIGVVLWSDEETGKAVIWCEDHGDLAFLNETDDGDARLLGAGDLVEFELSMVRQFRYAHNPQLVTNSYSNGLADSLSRTSPVSAKAPVETEAEMLGRMSAQIVPFRPRKPGKGKAAKPPRARLS